MLRGRNVYVTLPFVCSVIFSFLFITVLSFSCSVVSRVLFMFSENGLSLVSLAGDGTLVVVATTAL